MPLAALLNSCVVGLRVGLELAEFKLLVVASIGGGGWLASIGGGGWLTSTTGASTWELG